MTVSTTSILNKMQNEVKQANNTKANKSDMQKHVANIKLLCELILDEEEASGGDASAAVTTHEMKAMMGTDQGSVRSSSQKQKTIIDDDEANGESLFDF